MKTCFGYQSFYDGNSYVGFTNGGSLLVQKLYECNKCKDLEAFLRENGLNYNLKIEVINDIPQLYSYYNNGNKLPFLTVASTGTISLFLFYIWSISFKDVSLLFIDKFDAFFNYESAEIIVRFLNESTNFQSIITSHNIYLMQNKLTRPDCCFIMNNNKITSLNNATDKEIRVAHNLEKMYINGAFIV